jgi:hypothetical protein
LGLVRNCEFVEKENLAKKRLLLTMIANRESSPNRTFHMLTILHPAPVVMTWR